jgi:hypothetical protein
MLCPLLSKFDRYIQHRENLLVYFLDPIEPFAFCGPIEVLFLEFTEFTDLQIQIA